MEQCVLTQSASGGKTHDLRPLPHHDPSVVVVSRQQRTQPTLRCIYFPTVIVNLHHGIAANAISTQTAQQLVSLKTFRAAVYLVLGAMVLAAVSLFVSASALPIVSAVCGFLGCLIAASAAERYQRGG